MMFLTAKLGVQPLRTAVLVAKQTIAGIRTGLRSMTKVNSDAIIDVQREKEPDTDDHCMRPKRFARRVRVAARVVVKCSLVAS